MQARSIFRDRYGISLAMWTGRMLPRPVTKWVGLWLADRIASRRRFSMSRAVRANQWVVRGEHISGSELDGAVREVLRESAVGLLDLYHALHRPEELMHLAPRTPEMDGLIERSQIRRNPAIVVISHSSSFDLLLLAHSLRGLSGQVLTYAQPTDAYQIQNEIRSSGGPGLEVTPIGQHALRLAIENLRAGGVVYTGVDRPEDSSKMQLSFFGRPAWLPVGHVRLAMKVGVPIIVASMLHLEDGTYKVLLSDPIPMEKGQAPGQAIQENAQKVLEVLSNFIRQAPGQWMMFYPVWPEALEQMP